MTISISKFQGYKQGRRMSYFCEGTMPLQLFPTPTLMPSQKEKLYEEKINHVFKKNKNETFPQM